MRAVVFIGLLVLALLFPASGLSAQQRGGVHVSGDYTLHDVQMDGFPGVPSCCPSYQSGPGAGFTLGFWTSSTTSPTTELGFLLAYSRQWIGLQSGESIVVEGERTGRIEHQFDARFDNITVELRPSYRLTESLLGFIGPRVSYNIGSHLTQREVLLEPETGTFENGRRTRNEFDGPIAAKSKWEGAIVLGFRGEPIARLWETVRVSPELSYAVTFNSLVEQRSWRANQFRLALNFTLFQSASGASEPAFRERKPNP